MSEVFLESAPERVLLVRNDHATNDARIQKQLADVTCLPIQEVPTYADVRYTRDEIYKHAEATDIIIGSGGDGTARQITNILLDPETRERGLQRVPFVPVRGGDACDFAIMLNRRASVAEILARGRYFNFHPLEITVSKDGQTQTSYDNGYFGVGGNGAATIKLEHIKENNNPFTRLPGIRQLRQALVTWDAEANFPSFSARPATARHGAAQSISDILAVRGDRIAKYGRPHGNLTQPQLELILSKLDGRRESLAEMLRMQRGKLFGALIASESWQLESDDGSALTVMHDGDPDEIASGSIVTIAIAQESIITRTNRPLPTAA